MVQRTDGKNKQKLERVTKLAAKIIGMDVKELQGIFEANALTKLNLHNERFYPPSSCTSGCQLIGTDSPSSEQD